MKFEILTQKDNSLLKRKELELSVDYESGPTASKDAIGEFLQKNFSAAAESIEVVQIISDVGRARGKVRARIWEGTAPKPKEKKKAEGAAPAEKK